jgi:hypothetical protein
MADIRLAPQQSVDTGVTPTYTGSLTTTDTYVIRNSGRMIVNFVKTGAGDCVVTIQTPKVVGGLAVAEQTVTVVATTGNKFIGPFTPSLYNDGYGDVRMTLSNITNLTVAVLEM